MEDAGKVRRGYFVEGLSGSQFAYGGAIERLRSVNGGDEAPADDGVGPEDLLVLAAMDPANPYGALLPWPDAAEEGELKARRVTSAWVVLWRGRAALYAAQNGRRVLSFSLTTLPAGVAEAAFIRLARTAMPGRKGFLVIEQIDGRPLRESPLYERLRSAGFESDHRGLVAGPGLVQQP
jgi:ATP-dependent helicase Lhr and Lhr-like helicase